MLKFNVIIIVLVVIDLQEGIFLFVGGLYMVNEVVVCVVWLVEKCCVNGLFVVMVCVGWFDDYVEVLKQLVDVVMFVYVLLENWWIWFMVLGKKDSDLEVIKCQWGVFYGIDLELQFCCWGIDIIILCGILINIGVEFIVCNVWELGFNFIIVEDVCSVVSSEQYQSSMMYIFLCIGWVCSVEDILNVL